MTKSGDKSMQYYASSFIGMLYVLLKKKMSQKGKLVLPAWSLLKL